MRVERRIDPDGFLAATADLLGRHEAEHGYLFSLIAAAQAGAVPAEDLHLALVLDDARGTLGCAGRAPSGRLGLSRCVDLEAPAALAGHVHAAAPDTSSVHGPLAETDRFVTAWAERGGRAEQKMAMRHFAATAVELTSDVPGRPRAAGVGDRVLLVSWLEAFVEEALGGDPREATASADRYLDPATTSGVLLWEDPEPVSMAGFTGPTPTGISVLSVYTPPALRGRGYASAVVAALTRRLLDSGRDQVFLSTDLANPTSNRSYTRLGYRPVAEAAAYDVQP